MGLREQAQLDARAILEDTSGFAWPITLTSPLGVVTSLKGFTTDVGQTIDPETGQAVAGRRASAVLSLSSLPALPEAVAERSRKPWLARFADSTGAVASWKVVEVLPDRAAGVVVLLLEAFQPAIVVLTGRLVLPRLQLAGSATPIVGELAGALALPPLQMAGALTWFTLSGAVTLPPLQVAGSVAPTVALSGALGLPSLQVAGSLAPTVALSGTLVLPLLQLVGSVAPTVRALSGSLALPLLHLAGAVTPTVRALSGALALPSLQVAGSVSPTVSLSGALALPLVHLAGSISPTVGALSGALVLPHLQITGSLTWFTLSGALALPLVHLAGSISPTVRSLSGALVLQHLQLTGALPPKVTMAGALALPLVQLSGSYTTGALSMSAWLRVVNATLVSGDVSSLPDFLNANPAVQTVAGRRPTLENSANGLPCMRFGSGDVLSWPAIAANTNTATWGVGFWIKPDSLAGIGMLFSSYPLGGGASTFRLRFYTQGTSLTCEVYVSGSNGRFGKTAAVLTTGWQFVTLEYDSGGASEAAKLTITVGGTVRTLSFGNQGTGGTLGALVSVTGNHLIGDQVDDGSAGLPYAGLYGPHAFGFGAKMAGATTGLLTSAARAAYMNYEAPT